VRERAARAFGAHIVLPELADDRLISLGRHVAGLASLRLLVPVGLQQQDGTCEREEREREEREREERERGERERGERERGTASAAALAVSTKAQQEARSQLICVAEAVHGRSK
jgi:hypothetical protein